MREHCETPGVVDARYASWLSSNSSATVGYYMSCGMTVPEKREMPHGLGRGWPVRAVAAVLRECYRQGLSEPSLEDIEVAALSILPQPDEEEEGPGPRPEPGVWERWEEAVRLTAWRVRDVLRYGPAYGAAGARVLSTGGMLEAEVCGLRLEQRVDLVWRRPDGALEAVLIVEELGRDREIPQAADDWRCVLAAAIVRAKYGESPDLHVLFLPCGMARVEHLPQEVLEGRLNLLKGALRAGRDFRGLATSREAVFYRLSPEAEPPYANPPSRRPRRPRGSTPHTRE